MFCWIKELVQLYYFTFIPAVFKDRVVLAVGQEYIGGGGGLEDAPSLGSTQCPSFSFKTVWSICFLNGDRLYVFRWDQQWFWWIQVNPAYARACVGCHLFDSFSWRCEVYRKGNLGARVIKVCWVGICAPSYSTSDFSGDGGWVLLAQGCPRPSCEVEPGSSPTLKSSVGNSLADSSPATSWGVQQALGQLGWNCGWAYLLPPRHWKHGVPSMLMAPFTEEMKGFL